MKSKVVEIYLQNCDLSVRCLNCCSAADINTINDLIQYRKSDLLKFRNFGNKSIQELELLLSEHGLTFKLK